MTLTPHVIGAIVSIAFLQSPTGTMTVRYLPSAARLTAAERTVIERVAHEAEREGRTLLPTLKRPFVFEVEVGNAVIKETGETALTMDGTIRWTVDATRTGGASAIAERQLRPTLLHEMHHLAREWWFADDRRYDSFMEAVVSEGLATAFAREVTHGFMPWGEYPDNVSAWVTELSALTPNQSWPRYTDWMFDHPDGRRWIGYKAGTYIAERAMKASGKSAAQLVTTPEAEILRLAGSMNR